MLGLLVRAGRVTGLPTPWSPNHRYFPAIEVLEAALTELPDVGADEAKAELLATLSRAFMRNEAYGRAVEVADLALALAERLKLDRVMAEALNNKAASLSDMGRREAIALMEAAVQIAQAGGFIDAELRARNNLISILDNNDPGRASSEFRAILALAERAGNLEWVASAVLDVAETNYRNGDEWDGALARLDDLGARRPTPRRAAFSLASPVCSGWPGAYPSTPHSSSSTRMPGAWIPGISRCPRSLGPTSPCWKATTAPTMRGSWPRPMLSCRA
jgi:tetratricopeptide (TPR) repeat protein